MYMHESDPNTADYFLKMVKKQGSRLRAFEMTGLFFFDDVMFNQRVVKTLSDFAPNLELFKMHTNTFDIDCTS